MKGDVRLGDLWKVTERWGLPTWVDETGIAAPTSLETGETILITDILPELFLYTTNVTHVHFLTSRGVRSCYGNHIIENCRLMNRKTTWIPPRMPAPLLQELYWPDPWKVTVICIMLNCTQRKQVEPMIDDFFRWWPSAAEFIAAYEDENKRSLIIEMLRPLGFYNRRAQRIHKFSVDLLSKGLDDIRKLHGVGEYAARCYEMLFLGLFGEEAPDDHALTDYWNWYMETQKK
jgi:hypothetical protein